MGQGMTGQTQQDQGKHRGQHRFEVQQQRGRSYRRVTPSISAVAKGVLAPNSAAAIKTTAK